MNIQIDRQNDVPRITENGKIVYSEKSDTLYIRTLKEGTKAIGGNSSIIETDPVFTSWLASPPNVSTFTNDAGYLTSFSETDPIYTASSWYSTTNNSSNWNTAFSWGNHASAGYLTSITSGQVTAALGYTPYDATNPSGYITSSSLSSYVPTARTLTINGTTYDLTADRSWTISGSGVSALSAIGSTPNANSATITGSTLNLEPASVSFGGVVTTVAQTFAGRKTFNDYITIAGGTATAGTSPLKFTSGTNLTVAEAGSLEYNGSSLFFTRSGTLRAGILMTDIASPYNTYDAQSKGATAFTSGTNNFLGGYLAGGALIGGSQNVLIGTQAGNLTNPGLLNSVMIGYFAGQSASGTTANSVFIGSQAGQIGVGSYNSNFIGQLAGFNASSAYHSNLFGYQAGYGINANNVNFFGQGAGYGAILANDTVGIGQNAARNATGAVESIFIGKNSGYNSSGTGITGDYNIVIGSGSGTNLTSGGKNILVGYSLNVQSATTDGQLSIQNIIFGTGNTGTGTTISTGNIGIATVAPTARLHLPAGTASANTAPLKLTSGTNLTTPENGALEYDGTNLYFTTGGVRKTVQLI